MIEKLLPRVLNSSSDNRLKKKTEMNDALNIVVTEDFEDYDSSDDTGNEGVIKPVKGNTAQTRVPDGLFGSEDTRRVIGSVSDARTGVVYFFVYSTNVQEHGVYAYDTQNYFGEGVDSYFVIYNTAEFNFQQNSVVQGDIVHVTGDAGEFRPVLYFTDNVNEPRKLDVLRARTSLNYAQSSIHDKDLITACPKAPQNPITFAFERNDAIKVSDFRRVPGFQFAYQCIYFSGEESAISTYSDIAIPPEYLRQSIYTDQIVLSNQCRITVPAVVGGVFNYTQEIESLRLLVRQGNTGAFFVIDEIPVAGPGEDTTYVFRNDRVLSGITTEEQQKQFDNLPRVAEALAVVENRLFYGNYVEGYDEPNVQAQVTAQYIDRPADFSNVEVEITPVVVPLRNTPSDNLVPETLVQRVSGYKIDTSEVDDNIPANTFVSVNMTINPGRSYEMYNAQESYHASRIVGEQETASVGATFNSTDYSAVDFEGPNQEFYNGGGLFVFGRNVGVGSDNLMWKTTEGDQIGSDVPVTIGSSPASSLKFPGQSITFNLELELTESTASGKQLLLDAITSALTGGEAPDGVNVVFQNITPFIEWDHGFLDPEDAPGFEAGVSSELTNLDLSLTEDQLQATAIMPKSGDLDRARLIVPVCNDENNQVSGNQEEFAVKGPRGYFIVNSATVFFQLRHQSGIDLGDNVSVLNLEVSEVSGADVRTCIPIANNVYAVDGWRVYSGEYLETHFITDVDVTGEAAEGLTPFSYIFRPQFDSPVASQSNEDRRSIIGYLHSAGLDDVDDADLLVTADVIRESLGPQPYVQDSAGFSLLDGESGLSVAERDRSIPFFTIDEGPELLMLEGSTDIGCYAMNQFFGVAAQPTNVSDFFAPFVLNQSSSFDRFATQEHAEFEGEPTLEIALQDLELSEELELNYSAYIDQGQLTGSFRSFKTHANHDFGIVYYDERGRAGNVNRLDSVYVQGYSEQERGASKGRVEINIAIQSAPPDWAHHYQVVYAGNSSTRDFIQYSVGGAFTPVNVESEDAVPSRNIYVSLNYLQENQLVSYSKSFGAVAPDGTQNLYVYSPGDYLRVISYYTDEDNVVYPNNRVFEIADVVNLGSVSDDNPLVASGDAPPHLQGQFLVLKDNSAATGFSFNDVSAASNDVDTSVHNWNNRCVVEIVSPRSTVDPEDRVYHEVGAVYNVGRDTPDGAEVAPGLYHQTQNIIVRNGDVWWRRVPVNINTYDADQGLFLNLIREEEGESTEPAFRNYYLESKTFNDTFPGTDVNGFGKRKFISTLSNEVRRFSSVTFSDQNDYSTKRLRYTSFNAFNAPFKDLPNEHGNINALLNFSDSLFVVQEDKASAIPVSRNVLSDALGQDTLISSDQILGTQVFYAGAYGSDNNPESVLKVDNNIYFAHKSRGEVYKFNPSNGLQVISRKGMNSFFRDAFEDVLNDGAEIRIVSGYDPLKDEYLISIVNVQTLPQTPADQYTQPDINLIGLAAEPLIPDVPVIDTGGETPEDVPDVEDEDDVPEDTPEDTPEAPETGSPAVEGLFEQQLLATYSMRQVFNVPLSVRLRHSFTEAEQDIGFGEDGYVDPADIQAFIDAEGVGPSAIQVITWYDQSGGGNDAYQTNPLRAPLVATEDGIVYGANGRVAILFDIHDNRNSGNKKYLINDLNTTFVNRDFFWAWERNHAGSNYNDPTNPNPFGAGGNTGTLTSHSSIPPMTFDAYADGQYDHPYGDFEADPYNSGYLKVMGDKVEVKAWRNTYTHSTADFGQLVPEARDGFAGAMGPAVVNIHVSADSTDKSASINQYSADFVGNINATSNFNFGIGTATPATNQQYGVIGFMQEVRLYESLPPLPRDTVRDEMNAAWDLYSTDSSDTTDNTEAAT